MTSPSPSTGEICATFVGRATKRSGASIRSSRTATGPIDSSPSLEPSSPRATARLTSPPTAPARSTPNPSNGPWRHESQIGQSPIDSTPTHGPPSGEIDWACASCTRCSRQAPPLLLNTRMARQPTRTYPQKSPHTNPSWTCDPSPTNSPAEATRVFASMAKSSRWKITAIGPMRLSRPTARRFHYPSPSRSYPVRTSIRKSWSTSTPVHNHRRLRLPSPMTSSRSDEPARSRIFRAWGCHGCPTPHRSPTPTSQPSRHCGSTTCALLFPCQIAPGQIAPGRIARGRILQRRRTLSRLHRSPTASVHGCASPRSAVHPRN